MKAQVGMMEVNETLDTIAPSAAFEPQAAWQKLRVMLRDRLGETAFRRWLEPVIGTIENSVEGEPTLILALPTRFMRDWVEAHYGDTIRTMWHQLIKQGRVDFSVVSPLTKTNTPLATVEAQPLTDSMA